jgi:hypothetical protein
MIITRPSTSGATRCRQCPSVPPLRGTPVPAGVDATLGGRLASVGPAGGARTSRFGHERCPLGRVTLRASDERAAPVHRRGDRRRGDPWPRHGARRTERVPLWRVGCFATSLGICTGILGWAVAAVLGIATILATSSIAFTALKLIGAAYLIYLGISTLRSHDAFDGRRTMPARPFRPARRTCRGSSPRCSTPSSGVLPDAAARSSSSRASRPRLRHSDWP